MSRMGIVAAAVVTVAFVMAASGASLPKPWVRSLFTYAPYQAGVDTEVPYEGQPSLFIGAAFSPPTHIDRGVWTAKFSVASGIRQAIRADRYRARRVRWLGYLHTIDVGSPWESVSGRARRAVASDESSPGAGLYVVIRFPRCHGPLRHDTGSPHRNE